MSDPDHHARVRLLIDANVLISYSLTGNHQSTIGRLLRISFERRFELIVPNDLLSELRAARTKNAYLAAKLAERSIEALVSDLEFIGTIVDPARMSHSRILRDRGDDYLLTTAVIHDVEIIVSGDRHVLGVGKYLDRPRILTPADFVSEFGQQ